MNGAVVPEYRELLASYILCPESLEEIDDIRRLEAEFAELIMDVAVKLTDGAEDDYLRLVQVLLGDLKRLLSRSPVSTSIVIRVEEALVYLDHVKAFVEEVLQPVLEPGDLQLLSRQLFELRTT